jgi:hypothetical protein
MWNYGPAVVMAFMSLSVPSTPAQAVDDLQVAHIIVDGKGPLGGSLVYKFHGFLKENVAAEFGYDFGNEPTPVSCFYVRNSIRTCDQLEPSDANNALKLDYLTFRDKRHMSLFLLAWDKLVDMQIAKEEDTPVTLTIDATGPVGDCLDPDQAKQPCTNAPQCPYTTPRRCDKYSGAPCSSCGVP